MDFKDITIDDDTLDPNALLYDNFDINMPFNDSPLGDDMPLFGNDWMPEESHEDDSPPYETGLLCSTPLSWDRPQPGPGFKNEQQTPITFGNLDTLTELQQETLRNIAMPSSLNYQHSPDSTSTDKTTSAASSPEDQEGGSGGNRKRKSSVEGDDEDEEGGDGKPPVKKTAHNMIEKRYRTNLNDKIAALRDSVPSLRVMSKGEDGDGKEDLQGLTPAHKLNKATVLSKATEYIKHLEKRNRRLAEEAVAMKARLDAFEKLFMAGSMGMAMPQQRNYQQPPQFSNAADFGDVNTVDPQGMIQVPEDMRRLHAMAQMNQQLMNVPPSNRPVNSNGRQVMNSNSWNGGYFGKLMVGSLAGLMIMEGFNDNSEEGGDTPNTRGLFSVPTTYLKNLGRVLRPQNDINILGHHVAGNDIMTYFKLLLLVGAVVYIFLPSVVNKKPPKKSSDFTSTPASAPSLASSIDLRRKAWLTSTQSVWVPKHNFFLEATALCLKMLKLSLRSAIGAYGYSLLTGTTEDQEAARIKAWEIALDAQLAGGDVEVSKSRLILTLLASGTLPDTPTRLMLKAVHIRVLLWEFGNAGFKGFYMFDEFAAKLARWKWNEARHLHQLIVHTQRSTSLSDIDDLPEHLARLLEHECDEVLVDSIGQRAYNLAWNIPTTHNVTDVIDGMNSVVDDTAIRSPLDAVAAWWSSLALHRALNNSLGAGDDESKQADVQSDIELALKTAPIGSGAQVRALIARAVLLEEERGIHIAAALQVLSPLTSATEDSENVTTFINTTTSATSIPDVHLSLACAKGIAHLKSFSKPEDLSIAQTIIKRLVPANLSLLGFIATYNLMCTLDSHTEARTMCLPQLEYLAGNLRRWIGGAEGGSCGLDRKLRASVVDKCLEISKRVVGMDKVDEGISMTDPEEDGEGC